MKKVCISKLNGNEWGPTAYGILEKLNKMNDGNEWGPVAYGTAFYIPY